MEDKEDGRQTWGRNIDFLFMMVGQGVGFGNVWRFPYICYRNGGGAFLIPYLLAVIVLGIPAAFLEGALGQFTSRGMIRTWDIVPLFSGLGYMMTSISFYGKTAYSLLFAWVLYYMFSSMTAVLPWSHCNNPWNTPLCRENKGSNISSMSFNASVEYFNNSDMGVELGVNNGTSKLWMDPATEFWERKVLSISPGIEHVGQLKWDIALCLLLGWLLIYFCVWRGIRLTGKISYVTATAPYVLLLVIMVKGFTLKGSSKGIQFYLLPKWEKLTEGQVWLDACIQVFYSYAVGVSVHTALGSCNKFHHNILKHYCIFSVINSGTSFLCGFVIFSVLGFMADRQGVPIEDVAESGPGLAFIAYPEAIAQLPAPQLWSILFFLMLAFIAIDSEFAGVEAFVINVGDLLPAKMRTSPYKEIFTAVCCSIWYLLTLTMVTEGGIYVEQIVEWYCGGKIMLLVVFLECFVVACCYGVNRFQRNIEYMLGYRIGPFFKYAWLIVTPSICLVLLVMNIVSYPTLEYRRRSGTYYFPAWTQALGWSLAVPGFLCLPGVMIYKLTKTKGTLKQRVRHLLLPDFTETQRQRDRGVLGGKEEGEPGITLEQKA